ncbi:MAG: bacteriocin transport accessory protein [Oscillospiraceae bacterium]|nr:bacteriocin transport accessory protein [Oscillospiraceae bacterium]
MKKLKTALATALCIILTTSMVSCTDKKDNNSSGNESQSSQTEVAKVEDTLELLNSVWANYKDEEKFACGGGDFSEENMTMDAPGKYSVEDKEAVDASLGIPAANVDMIDNAASLVHMMNANTFTGAAYHVKKTDDVSPLADAIKENILARQWMCGIPELYVIFRVDDCLVTAFGETSIINTFKTKVTETYKNAEVLHEGAIE